MNTERWQRIVDLFERTANQAPEDRAAFLARACAGDESLRRAVENGVDDATGEFARAERARLDPARAALDGKAAARTGGEDT